MTEISSKAKIGINTNIKPFCVIEDDVVIGDNVVIGPNAFIGNGSRIANNVTILHSSSISVWPNSIGYKEEISFVEIGEGTIIKGLTTICKSASENQSTKVGNNCYLMNHVHIAHDNIIGDNVILTNGVNLGGFVEIGQHSMLGGLIGVHQFSKIGEYTMIESNTKVSKDVPPYILAGRNPLRYMGLNVIGLRRKGFSNEIINQIKDAYRIIYSAKLNFSDALKRIPDEMPMTKEIQIIYDFVSNSKRGIIPKEKL